MREMISAKIASFEAHHQGLKEKRWGALVGPGTIALGWVVLMIGLVTIPFPGPGWLTVFVGVAIISLEQSWAKSVLGFGVKAYDKFFAWFHQQNEVVRYSLVAGLLALILVTFSGLFYGAWALGWADFADPAMLAMGLEKP